MSDEIYSPTGVLIIGAGPTGLTLACELARREVSHRIIDRADHHTTASRAKAIQPRALEVADGDGPRLRPPPDPHRPVHAPSATTARTAAGQTGAASAMPPVRR